MLKFSAMMQAQNVREERYFKQKHWPAGPGCLVPRKVGRSPGRDGDSDRSEWKGAMLLMP